MAAVPQAGAGAPMAGAGGVQFQAPPGAPPPPGPGQQQQPPQQPDPLDEVRMILTTCGVRMLVAANSFIDFHDITELGDFVIMKPSDAYVMFKAYNDSLQPRQRDRKFGSLIQKKFAGFLTWYHDQVKRGITPAATDFTADAMITAVNEFDTAKSDRETGKFTFDPPKLDTGMKWFTYKSQMLGGFALVKGVDNDYLFYITLPIKPAGWVPADAKSELEAQSYQLALTGPVFVKDNRLTAGYIQKSAVGHKLYPQLTKYFDIGDGRGAWHFLVKHCEGDSQNNNRILLATRTISLNHNGGGIFYISEYSLSWERYTSLLIESYEVIKNYHNDHAVQAKVQRLLDGMEVKTNSVILDMAKQHIIDNYFDDFEGAINYMAGKVAQVFPPKSSGTKRKYEGRSRQISEVGSRGGRGRGGRGRGWGLYGRGRGPYGRGRGGYGGSHGNNQGKHDPATGFFSGVDCNDYTRRFTSQEMSAMGKDGRDHIFAKRNSDKKNNPRQIQFVGSNTGRDDVSNISNDQTNGGNTGAMVPYNNGGAAAGNDNNSTASGQTGKGSQNGNAFGRGGYKAYPN